MNSSSSSVSSTSFHPSVVPSVVRTSASSLASSLASPLASSLAKSSTAKSSGNEPAKNRAKHKPSNARLASSAEATVLQDNTISQQKSHAQPLFRGQFEVTQRLGRGGFGTTYLAKDMTASPAMPCVLKQIRYRTKKNPTDPLPPNPAIVQERHQRRFQKEARMMARLGRHSQMPCILEHFTENGQFYIVQEHIPGNTLSKELHQEGPQSEAQAKAFLQAMIPIIRYVHKHNLLHLDIKPSNIIRRSSDNALVLIDFGAVRRQAKKGELPQSCSGTVGFSPAEQLAGKPVPASDVYSLGVTCLYLLTGISPIDLATSPKGQNLRWKESVQVSEHFSQILQKMLAPDVQHRYQSIDELDRALQLEAHYPELKACMTAASFEAQNPKPPTACLLDDYLKAGSEASGESKAHRQAVSIRRWQQRRRQFKSFTPK
ncbi:MAG: serine/threonine-protein kinase [Cyanobacteria bacterium J06607_10]